MDDARIAISVLAVAEMERGIRFYLDTTESPLELARGWEAYRGAVALRKALDKWIETRRWLEVNARNAGEA
jgi:hypothetical protein